MCFLLQYICVAAVYLPIRYVFPSRVQTENSHTKLTSPKNYRVISCKEMLMRRPVSCLVAVSPSSHMKVTVM